MQGAAAAAAAASAAEVVDEAPAARAPLPAEGSGGGGESAQFLFAVSHASVLGPLELLGVFDAPPLVGVNLEQDPAVGGGDRGVRGVARHSHGDAVRAPERAEDRDKGPPGHLDRARGQRAHCARRAAKNLWREDAP